MSLLLLSTILFILILLFICLYWRNNSSVQYYRRSPSYDNITTIITTSPYPSTNVEQYYEFHLRKTLLSLRHIPELFYSKVIIGFDGDRVSQEFKIDTRCQQDIDPQLYQTYKQIVKQDSVLILPRVQFVECPYRYCLTRNLYECMKHVNTKYVNIMQQDLPIIKPFRLSVILDLMESNPQKYKWVRYSCRSNQDHERFLQEISQKPLALPHSSFSFQGQIFSRCNQWSDQDHISTKEYYDTIVFPTTLPRMGFMEQDLRFRPIQEHDVFGTYYLGNHQDGHYCEHTDGRKHV